MDMTTRAQVQVNGSLSWDMKHWFAFGNQGRILTYDYNTRGGAMLREFPSGKTIFKFHVGEGVPAAVTKGDYIHIAPVKDYAALMIEAATDKAVMGLRLPAIDIYDKTYVNENRSGTLVMADIGSSGAVNPKSVILPRAELANVRSVAISDDLSWLALSQASRGAIFDLHQGSRELHVRSFHGAWFNSDGTFVADFPKYEKTDRSLVSLDLKTKNFNTIRKLEEKPVTRQQGPYTVVWKSEEKHPDRVTVEIHEIHDDKLLWSRPLEGGHFFSEWMSDIGVILWQGSATGAEKAAANDSAIRQKLNAVADKKQSFYIEVLDLKSGHQLGWLVIDTGKASFRVRQVQATPTMVLVGDTEDRVRIYSLKDGAQQGVIFADRFDISNAGLLVVGTGDNRLEIYDTETLEQVDQFSFGDKIAIVRFIGSGNRLLVITRDQTVFVLEPNKTTGVIQATAQ
jgi:WD40 repeat protein